MNPNTTTEFSKYAQKVLPIPKSKDINSSGDDPEDLLRFQAKVRRRASRHTHSSRSMRSTQNPNALPPFAEVAAFAGMGGMGVIANPGLDGSISSTEREGFRRRTKQSLYSRRSDRSWNRKNSMNRVRTVGDDYQSESGSQSQQQASDPIARAKSREDSGVGLPEIETVLKNGFGSQPQNTQQAKPTSQADVPAARGASALLFDPVR